MKQTVYFGDFSDAFRNANRKENFSYEGQRMLFEYLEEYEESCGEEIELDVIALCCEYNEDHWEDIAGNYDVDLEDEETDEDKKQAVIKYLEENTSYIGEPLDGFLLYQAF